VTRRSLRALGVAFALLLAGAPPARAGSAPPTHRAVLDSLADRVAADLLADGEFPAGRTVALDQPIVGDSLGALGQRLVERLKGRGLALRLTAAPGAWMPGGVDPAPAAVADPGDLRLQVRVQASGVTYVRARRGFPGRVTVYERLGFVRASATLLDGPSRAVLWAHSASAERRDRVGKGDLAAAAVGSGGLAADVPRGGGIRFLEPLIVAGVVTGLVVLFYSNRN